MIERILTNKSQTNRFLGINGERKGRPLDDTRMSEIKKRHNNRKPTIIKLGKIIYTSWKYTIN